MKKLILLLKTQFRASINSAAAQRMSKRKKSEGIKQATLGKPSNTVVVKTEGVPKVGGYMALMIFVGAIMFGMVFGFCYLMAMSLEQAGQLEVIPAIMMAIASIMCLITTIYKVRGTLFGFGDYDLVMSLPLKTSTVVISRMVILYSLNVLFTLLIVVPSLIVYAMFADPLPLSYWPVGILALIFIPLIPIVVAAILGSLIAIAASHFKRKSGASMIFTVALMLVWILFCMNMTTIATNFAAISGDVLYVMNGIYPLTNVYAKALTQADPLSIVLFFGITAAVFAAFVAIVGKNFKHLNAVITKNRTTSNYKMQALEQRSPKKALFQKEWKRFTTSSTYMMNTGIGAILLIIFSVVLVIFGGDTLEGFLQMPGLTQILGSVAPFVIALFVGMTCTTACSISLEGKQLWIIKSVPVRTRDILMAKLRVNLQLLLVTIAISATLFVIALRPAPLDILMTYLTPVAYAFFVSLFGLVLNLNMPDFNWDTEIKAVKQSMPTLIIVLLGMVLALVPLFLAFAFGSIVTYIMTAALAVVSILLYRRVMTKGVTQFDALSG